VGCGVIAAPANAYPQMRDHGVLVAETAAAGLITANGTTQRLICGTGAYTGLPAGARGRSAITYGAGVGCTGSADELKIGVVAELVDATTGQTLAIRNTSARTRAYALADAGGVYRRPSAGSIQRVRTRMTVTPRADAGLVWTHVPSGCAVAHRAELTCSAESGEFRSLPNSAAGIGVPPDISIEQPHPVALGPGVKGNLDDGAADSSDPVWNPLHEDASVPGATTTQDNTITASGVDNSFTLPVDSDLAHKVLGWPKATEITPEALANPFFADLVHTGTLPGVVRGVSFDAPSTAASDGYICSNAIFAHVVRRKRINVKGGSSCSRAVAFIDTFTYFQGGFSVIDEHGPFGSTFNSQTYIDFDHSKAGLRGDRSVCWTIRHVASNGSSVGRPCTPYRGQGKSL
jgi:hypothetical protein